MFTAFPLVKNNLLFPLQLNQNFLKKIPEGSEVANIMVGELECLKYQITAFVRLTEARTIGDLTEVPLPTRFVFILLGPPGSQNKNVEIGRSISTIMVDEVRDIKLKKMIYTFLYFVMTFVMSF